MIKRIVKNPTMNINAIQLTPICKFDRKTFPFVLVRDESNVTLVNIK